jgi:hypothetical protein
LETLSFLIVTRWGRWILRWIWHRFWCKRLVLVWCRCTHYFAGLLRLCNLCSAIFTEKAAVDLIFSNHWWVSFCYRLNLSMPWRLNSMGPQLLGCSVCCHNQLLYFRHCCVQNPPSSNLAIFKAKCILDCSRWIWPPFLAIVADMFKTYKKVVTASKG